MAEREPCEVCDDGEGGCVFPYYGVAPHTHDTSKGMIGSTRVEPKVTWPANFEEDADQPGYGVYTHCEICGRPNNYGGSHAK